MYYDSLHKTLQGAANIIIASLCQHKSSTIKVLYHDVQWQSGFNDVVFLPLTLLQRFVRGRILQL